MGRGEGATQHLIPTPQVGRMGTVGQQATKGKADVGKVIGKLCKFGMRW